MNNFQIKRNSKYLEIFIISQSLVLISILIIFQLTRTFAMIVSMNYYRIGFSSFMNQIKIMMEHHYFKYIFLMVKK